MIIASFTELQVGSISMGDIADANLEWHTTTLAIVREATEEEYLKQLADWGLELNPWPEGEIVRFYEVWTD